MCWYIILILYSWSVLFHFQLDDDHDSGTESDDENQDLEDEDPRGKYTIQCVFAEINNYIK